MAVAPERSRIPVEGADIEMLTWGEVGKPGLLFLHGNGAHADWWSFIAPFFAKDWRWRRSRGRAWAARTGAGLFGPSFAAEIFAAVEAAGLEAGGVKPILVGHSFGGFPPSIARRARRPAARRRHGRQQHPAAGEALEGPAEPRRTPPTGL
jgi:pimeloyl-ACP methyl ester carboxylesterase